MRAIAAAQDRLVELPLARLRAEGFEDVTPALLAILLSMGADGSRLVDLRAIGGRSKQAISQLVEELRRRGYAEVVASPVDGRSKLVVPTIRGSSLRASGIEALDQLSIEVARVLGDEVLSFALSLERLVVAL